jgi:hypothetical protein
MCLSVWGIYAYVHRCYASMCICGCMCAPVFECVYVCMHVVLVLCVHIYVLQLLICLSIRHLSCLQFCLLWKSLQYRFTCRFLCAHFFFLFLIPYLHLQIVFCFFLKYISRIRILGIICMVTPCFNICQL